MPTFRTACESSKPCPDVQQRLKSPFDALQKWHTYLLNTRTQQPPQGNTPVALEQLTAADKELWMGVSHKVGASLPSDHDFPVDQAIQELMLTPPVAMQLLPGPRAPSLSESIGQDLPSVHPKGVASPPPSPRAVARLSPVSRRPCKEKGRKAATCRESCSAGTTTWSGHARRSRAN